jgi:hypothetical protein
MYLEYNWCTNLISVANCNATESVVDGNVPVLVDPDAFLSPDDPVLESVDRLGHLLTDDAAHYVLVVEAKV